MASSTLTRPSAVAPAESPQASAPPRWRRALPGLLFALVLLVVAAGVVLWARTRPGFDPFGWLVWGRKTIDGGLDTNAAPSWKPLPYLFTVPLALAGHLQVGLWLWISCAVSLSSVVFAARIALRLVDAPPERRYAGWAAAAFAGVAVLGIQDLAHYVLSAQSDPMIVALCLGAIDAHLSKRLRTALVLGGLAALGRPEVWPFLGLYWAWCWRVAPPLRLLIAGEALVLAALWFGIPALTSRSAFVAGNNALGSGRALHSDKVWGTVRRFLDLHAAPVELAALASVALAAWRRDRAVLLLGAGVVVWVVVEIAFALHGWPGLPRYMFEASAVMVVLAAVLVGRLLSGDLLGRGARLSPALRWGGFAVALAVAGLLVPTAVSRVRLEQRDLRVQRARTDQIGRLNAAIRRVGGPERLVHCGEPLTHLQWQTVLAWNLRLNVVKIGWKYGPAMASRRPIVLFTPTAGNGWRVQALHQTDPSCRALPR